jgi:hypothetical protein
MAPALVLSIWISREGDTMANSLDIAEARNQLTRSVNQAIADQFKVLLETKHLYQSVVAVDFETMHRDIAKQVPIYRQAFEEFVDELRNAELTPSEQPLVLAHRYEMATLLLQNVKLFCSRCKQRETFSPTFYMDATRKVAERNRSGEIRIALHPHRFQVFALVYQCESCKDSPMSFLVKRQGWKLTVEGRSPFEEVEVPKFIPKHEEWLFRGAIVAAQTGNTLAGLFYLRCFIEQFARRQTGMRGRQTGEEMLDTYQSLLPETQRDHMPSLRSWYEKLSVPIHAAEPEPDDSLFEEAKTAIVNHFDFRRIFKIPDVNPPKAADAGKSPAEKE